MREYADLPINALKRETYILDKLTFTSHDGQNVHIEQIMMDGRLHRNDVKVSFFITAFRTLSLTTADLVGNYVSLHEGQYFYRPTFLVGDIFNSTLNGFYVGFTTTRTGDALFLNLQCASYNGAQSRIWLENISVMDSDFDKNIGWLNENDEDNIRDIVRPLPPIFTPPEYVKKPQILNTWIRQEDN